MNLTNCRGRRIQFRARGVTGHSREDFIGHLTMGTHTQEKPFSCSKCSKAFNQSAHLKTHEKTHTGEKPFACSKCDKSFTDSGYLKQHEMIHTGENPFVCSKCDRQTKTKAYLKQHQSGQNK